MYPQSSYTVFITTNGLFQNNGNISGKNYLNFDTNKGPWLSYSVRMIGTGNHIVLTDPNFTFSPSNFTALTSTVTVSTTPLSNNGISSSSFLRFDNSRVQIMKLVLEPGSSLYLVSNSSLAVKQLIGNGNEVKLINNSYLSSYSAFGNSSFENVNFTGNVGIASNVNFNGDCYLNGNMYPETSHAYTITSNGLFQNNGDISGKNYLLFNINGDLENTGNWVSYAVSIQGTSEQHIGVKDTAFISKVKVYANRSGNSFQWMLNGSPLTNGGDISGATSNILSIKNFDSRFFGTLKSEIDSSGNAISSRNIIVNDIITEVNDDGGGKGNKGKGRNKNQIPKIFSLS